MRVESLPLLASTCLYKKKVHLLALPKNKSSNNNDDFNCDMDEDDAGINCHQSCSGLEMNQMMSATNLGGSEVVNKNIQRWMEA